MSTSLDVQQCDSIQILEPDSDVPVATVSGAISDPALTERGEVVLTVGQSEVAVVFGTPKINANYRFEYLYVDDLGGTTPGTIQAVPTIQTQFGFTVELAGVPVDDSTTYTLRWRVVIVDATANDIIVDAPERQYLQVPFSIPVIPQPPPAGFGTLAIVWVNPRSTTDYGFSELRVENLIDDPSIQTFVGVQVVAKTLSGCTVAFNPVPRTGNYYLTVRTP